MRRPRASDRQQRRIANDADAAAEEGKSSTPAEKNSNRINQAAAIKLVG